MLRTAAGGRGAAGCRDRRIFSVRQRRADAAVAAATAAAAAAEEEAAAAAAAACEFRLHQPVQIHGGG